MHKSIPFLLLLLVIIEGCISTAKVSEFPKTAAGCDFTAIANSKDTSNYIKKRQSKFEYYLTGSKTKNDLFIKAVLTALQNEKFTIRSSNIQSLIDENNTGAIIAERGLTGTEWKTIAGIYYKTSANQYQVYINCVITQDITGNCSSKSEAEQIGEKICAYLGNCSTSYIVHTTN